MARRRARKRVSKRRSRKSSRKSGSWGAVAVRGLGGLALKVLKRKLGLNTETHYKDTVDAAAATTTTFAAFQTDIITIPIGDTVVTRTGRSVRITSISIRGTLRAVSAQTEQCRVRIVGFVQRNVDTPGAVLAATDVLEDHTAQLNTPYDMNTTGYSIIFDRVFTVSPFGQEGSTKDVRISYTPLDHHCLWTSADTTGVYQNILKGYVRFLIATDAASTHEPTFESYGRTKWVDN